MNKPVVTCEILRDDWIQAGFTATIKPKDHPSDKVSNITWARTSRVIDIRRENDKIIEFETENTVYKVWDNG